MRANPTMQELFVAYKYHSWQNQRWVGKERNMSPVGKFTKLYQVIMDLDANASPQSILEAMDAFTNKDWMMTLGAAKGSILQKAVKEQQPQLALELGSYCGYSTVAIASCLPPTGHLISVDVDARYLHVTQDILRKAGLQHRVTLLRAFAEELHLPSDFGPVDFLFLDHAKHLYLPTLKHLEPLLHRGSVVMANGTGMFPQQVEEYLVWVRSSGLFDSVEHHTVDSNRENAPDALECSVYRGRKHSPVTT
eukprot:GGOE01018161.1.p1 GENE.GGOE01018161.1~~GGOE01018161.1.p1  ORF type:complete len:265 (+),score=47.23 GGOE01018161.1:48-797(+)